MVEKKEEEQRKKMELLTRGAEWIQAHWRGLLARREGEKARKKGKKKGKKGKKWQINLITISIKALT